MDDIFQEYKLVCDTQYYLSENIKYQSWYIQLPDGQLLHHPNLPAFTFYNEDGVKISETWFDYGKRNRGNELPSLITYHPNGNIKRKRWYKNDLIHREDDLPAEIIYFSTGKIQTEKWIKYNIIQREKDLPAWKMYNEEGKLKIEQWFYQNSIFRFGLTNDFQPKPAVKIYDNKEILEHYFYRLYNNLLSSEKYLKIAYLFRRKILKFKKRKRNELVNSLKFDVPNLYHKNGLDILKYISKFVY
jgi:hypothetical protein